MMRSHLLATTFLALTALPAAAQTFTVSASGGFVAPDGQQWNMRGLNAGVQDALQGFQNVLTDFPGLTAIRLNVNPSSDSAASVSQVVSEYTAAGVAVEIEDHSGNGDNVAWYQQEAQQFKTNGLVFLEMPNEPSWQRITKLRRSRPASSTQSAPPGFPTQSACSLLAASISQTHRW